MIEGSMSQTDAAFLVLVGICCVLAGCSPQSATSGSSAVPPANTESAPDYGDVHVLPASGSGAEGVFRVTISQKPTTQKAALVGLLINKSQNGENACYAFWNLTNGETTLVADAGTGVLPLKGPSVENRQCRLLRDGTSSTQDASGVTVNFHLRFLSSFRGLKQLWAMAGDPQGKGELKPAGYWTTE
jgi:hypothetical protein